VGYQYSPIFSISNNSEEKVQNSQYTAEITKGGSCNLKRWIVEESESEVQSYKLLESVLFRGEDPNGENCDGYIGEREVEREEIEEVTSPKVLDHGIEGVSKLLESVNGTPPRIFLSFQYTSGSRATLSLQY